jgi:hypothetical protein
MIFLSLFIEKCVFDDHSLYYNLRNSNYFKLVDQKITVLWIIIPEAKDDKSSEEGEYCKCKEFVNNLYKSWKNKSGGWMKNEKKISFSFLSTSFSMFTFCII